MKPWARSFYTGRTWEHTRNAYAASVGGLCEKCLALGYITPGAIVHHKVHLTPANIDDPSITLDWSNLELLCRNHHADAHRHIERRYTVDEMGRVISI